MALTTTVGHMLLRLGTIGTEGRLCNQRCCYHRHGGRQGEIEHTDRTRSKRVAWRDCIGERQSRRELYASDGACTLSKAHSCRLCRFRRFVRTCAPWSAVSLLSSKSKLSTDAESSSSLASSADSRCCEMVRAKCSACSAESLAYVRYLRSILKDTGKPRACSTLVTLEDWLYDGIDASQRSITMAIPCSPGCVKLSQLWSHDDDAPITAFAT